MRAVGEEKEGDGEDMNNVLRGDGVMIWVCAPQWGGERVSIHALWISGPMWDARGKEEYGFGG